MNIANNFYNVDMVISAIDSKSELIKNIVEGKKYNRVYHAIITFTDDSKLFIEYAVAGSFITHDSYL